MKVLGFIGFVMISAVGTWSQNNPADLQPGPEIASFLPGQLPHSSLSDAGGGCD